MSKRGLVPWTFVIAAFALGAAAPAGAEEQKPYRVRGSLEAVQGDQVTVKSREGETLEVALKDDSRVLVVRPPVSTRSSRATTSV